MQAATKMMAITPTMITHTSFFCIQVLVSGLSVGFTIGTGSGVGGTGTGVGVGSGVGSGGTGVGSGGVG